MLVDSIRPRKHASALADRASQPCWLVTSTRPDGNSTRRANVDIREPKACDMPKYIISVALRARVKGE